MLLTSTGSGMVSMFAIWGVVLVMMYFMMLRPQKKEQKRLAAMLASLEVGDVVVTTSGFYGVLIDITDEDVIVEFGSNRNCRIPMKKAAIQEVEKQN
ncbi:MAG: preprotein translocase subunit YajC [Lachnospiraceae bacterium]|nr:preprotein translocase subunit YajC [Lachnospiraceae bacterium]